MTDIKALFILFSIYLLLDMISSHIQNMRISNLEDELKEIKERNEGADNDR